MAKKRYVTKREALSYEPLEDYLTGGAKNGFNTERANMYELWSTYSGAFGYLRRWAKPFSKFDLRREGVQSFLNAFPEYEQTFEEMAKQYEIAEKAINKYDDIRIKFVDELKAQHFTNPKANFETLYTVMTDEQEVIYNDLKANPEKVNALKARKAELEAELAKLPQDRAYAPVRKPYKDELESIQDQLKLLP